MLRTLHGLLAHLADVAHAVGIIDTLTMILAVLIRCCSGFTGKNEMPMRWLRHEVDRDDSTTGFVKVGGPTRTLSTLAIALQPGALNVFGKMSH